MVRAFGVTVTCVDDRSVILDEMYPCLRGGGQSADWGVPGGVDVEHAHTNADGVIVRDLVANPSFAAGDETTGVVDGDFWTYRMRAHIASHVLYGAGRRISDDSGYDGFDISAEKAHADFETSTKVDGDALVELERLINRVVWDSREVSWEEISVAETRDREKIASNVKTEEGIFSESETVRVVFIDGWDWAVYGDTHVLNTVEIGPIGVLGRPNPDEGLTRIEFAVGSSAVDYRTTVRGSTYGTVRTLGANLNGLGESAAAATTAREELEPKLVDLKSKVLYSRLTDFETIERDGLTWNVDTVSGFDMNGVGKAAKKARDGAAIDVLVVVGESDVPFAVVASAGGATAGKVVAEAANEFGGGGGDGLTFTQGGGLEAPAGKVLMYLRD